MSRASPLLELDDDALGDQVDELVELELARIGFARRPGERLGERTPAEPGAEEEFANPIGVGARGSSFTPPS
jgi:hypothetical protein